MILTVVSCPGVRSHSTKQLVSVREDPVRRMRRLGGSREVEVIWSRSHVL